MARANKYTAIPKKGKSDPQVDAIAANLELLTGQKGQGGKRAVLIEDLQNLGIALFTGGQLRVDPDFQPGQGVGGGGTPPITPIIEPPTTPTGFAANGAFQYISFLWDAPTYTGHAYTEVWLSLTDDFSLAARVGVTPATVFGYSTEFGYSGYAWIRHVNQNGVVSPLNQSAGTPVSTTTDPQDLLDQLVGKIGEEHLDPDIDGQLEHLYDTIDWIEHAKAEGMMFESVTQDTYAVENRIDNKLLTAKIQTEYYTGVDTDKAIASATTALKAEIEDPNGSSVGANLSQNYYTAVKTDEAISAATTTLKADIENPDGSSVGANLANNYYTSAQTDSAISSATTSLKADIENPDGTSIGADLVQNYYTKVDADKAISQATTRVKAEIEDPNGTSLGASLEQTNQAVADVDGYQEALWGVKASAGDITASIGLVAKSNPNNPSINDAYFYVKDADMRVGYTINPGTGQESVVPIFGTIEDPNDSSRRVLVIDTAYLKVANIKELVVGDIIADSIVSNSRIVAPTIVGGEISIGNSYSVDSNGYMRATNCDLTGIINATGGSFSASLITGKLKANQIDTSDFLLRGQTFTIPKFIDQSSGVTIGNGITQLDVRNLDYGTVANSTGLRISVETSGEPIPCQSNGSGTVQIVVNGGLAGTIALVRNSKGGGTGCCRWHDGSCSRYCTYPPNYSMQIAVSAYINVHPSLLINGLNKIEFRYNMKGLKQAGTSTSREFLISLSEIV